MGHVYGDSTPFPYDLNFIELLRGAIECGVSLMGAQQAISSAADRSGSFEQIRKAERARMAAMSDAIRLSMTAFMSSSSERMARTASRVLETAQGVIEQELGALEGQASGEQSSTRSQVEHAIDQTARAIETFLLHHDLPNTSVCLNLVAGEQAYSGQVVVSTPFGVEAVFVLAIPAAHDWGKPRRVAELSAGTEIHLPQEAGWLSKRVELQPVKLDKLFVSEVVHSEEGTRILLRKAPRAGAGYELAFTGDSAAPEVAVRRLDENGAPSRELARSLEGEDVVHATRLRTRVVDSTRDLTMRRQAMTAGTFDGKPFAEIGQPRDVVLRLVTVLAPVAQEIAHRSGAPGELVLRRDLGEGRREEIYITKAELAEKLLVLPPPLRSVFDPFELSDGPRSPRAPSPSEPIFIGTSADDEEPTTNR